MVVISAYSATEPESYQNPIIPGFHPDPSLCRVGDDYYLVTSTFEWFPGIPIHHSKDLVNWELIGHAIERPDQLKNLNLWAPTIRHHEGLFYMICTETPGNVFFVTAEDPAGDWSDPIYIDIDPQIVSAIDPSLYWDEDGTCWFSANDRKLSGTIKHWLWIQKIDLTPIERNGRMEATLFEERRYISKGSGVGPDNFAEGPHIFKYADMYYLLIAEGGTWGNHAMSVMRTADLEAPLKDWEYNPNNPILTHRDKKSPISATGHADFVETQNGEWWSTHLGVRKQDGNHKLGRETFLVPVKWIEDESGKYWPAYNPDNGHMSHMEDKRPDLPWSPVPGLPEIDEFEFETLHPMWNFYHTPEDFDWFDLRDGKLVVDLRQEKATDSGNCGFIGRRQQHHDFDASLTMEFSPEAPSEVAGLMASIKNTNHIRLEISKNEGDTFATLFYVTKQGEKRVAREKIKVNDSYTLKLEARGWDFQFYAGSDKNNLKPIGEIQNARILSSEVAKGFTGSYVGMYASNNGKDSDNTVSFESFSYKPIH